MPLPDSIAVTLAPRTADIGGFTVHRVLPPPDHSGGPARMVGPFIFWDQMGPGEFLGGRGVDVRPHPHIGLATLTYLFHGTLDHRDSLGSHQRIVPGDVNLMTAGGGITHSERTGADVRAAGPSRLFGIQSWLALPRAEEACAPAFVHTPGADIPEVAQDGATTRVVVGAFAGARSPVAAPGAAFYLDVRLEPAGRLPLPADAAEERAVFPVSGALEVDGAAAAPGQMLLVKPGAAITLSSPGGLGAPGAHCIVLGGAVADGPRHIWWNFVASEPQAIRAAAQRWEDGGFDPVPNDPEHIPLPRG